MAEPEKPVDDPLSFLDSENGLESEPATPPWRNRRIVTLCGFGLRYLSAGDRDSEGRCYATRWVVMFALPIWPQSRDLIRALQIGRWRGSECLTFDRVSVGPPHASEVLRTYLMAALYFLAPAAFCWLGILVAPWLSKPLGVMPAEIAMAAFIVAAVWLVSWPIAAIHFRDKRLLGDRVIVTTERLWD